MWKTIVKLPNGSEISSGTTEDIAIRSFSLTECVNEEQELTFGSVCAAMAELTVICPGEFPVQAGDTVTLFRENASGHRKQIGLFIAEKPQRQTAATVKLTAYDRVTELDRDLTGWLEGLNGWPYKLRDLAQMVCDACGLTMVAGDFLNGDYSAPKFAAGGITGRQLIRWIGELAGCFCRCNQDGNLEFAWYTPSDTVLSSGGEQYYFQNGFSNEGYQTEIIHQIRIRVNGEDVGTLWPEEPAGSNAYTITGNPLAAGSVVGVLQTLYERLQNVSYTPCKLRLPGQQEIACGQMISVLDSQGQQYPVYVMKRRLTGSGQVLECTGSRRRDSAAAVNQLSFKALSGKMLNLQTTVDGLRVENRDQAGKMAGLTMDVEGITSEVARQQTDLGGMKEQLTTMAQTAEGLDIRIQEMAQSGAQKVKTTTGFTLDAGGLTISRQGTRMENLLNESGMFVKRSGQVLLQADQTGVTAVDVSVGNYLMVGDHARLEDYSSGADNKRTACFWI